MFEEKARKVHGMKYDYSAVEYQTAKTKVKIICPEHGPFLQTPNNHLSGFGCRECNKRKNLVHRNDVLSFTKKFVPEHINVYWISEKDEAPITSKIKIICSVHNKEKDSRILDFFKMSKFCTVCSREKMDTRAFIEKATKIHKGYYSYEKATYNGSHNKLTVTCPKHGDFEVSASNHINRASGCSSCRYRLSSGEEIVKEVLTELEIFFMPQFTPPQQKFRFDFFLPALNAAIEYNGEYHYHPQKFSKDDDPDMVFEQVQKRDSYKKRFCEVNDIRLLVIPYHESEVKEKIVQFLGLDN